MRNPAAVGGVSVTRATTSFVAFSADEDPLLVAWARFRAPLAIMAVDRRSAAPSVPGGVVQPRQGQRGSEPYAAPRRMGFWRLVASNNRELGRSYHLYDSHDRAREHVLQLQADARSLVVEVVPGPRTGSTGWVLRHDGQPVLTCGRWYASASTGAASAAGALGALASAAVFTSAELRHASGRVRRLAPAGSTGDA